jgi:endonuclease-8
MPEGDTLHRIAKAAAPRLVGRVALRVEAPRLASDVGPLVGETITRVEARGKYLVIVFGETYALLTHLRMTGKWHLYAPGERWRRSPRALSALVAVEGTEACCFAAPVVRILRARDLPLVLGDAALGPDVLGEAFDAARAVRSVRGAPELPLGEALLDQRLVAGIGNVWKSELLFRERLDPFAPVASFGDAALLALFERARASMMAAVAQPPRLGARAATSHYAYTRDSSARRGIAARTTRSGCEIGKGPIAVYGRAGRACEVCGGPIAMERQGRARRSTYFCPRCQRGG